MADISKVTLPNGKEYDLKDTTARNAANSAVPNTRTVNGKALSSNISLGAGDVGAYTKKETDTKINAAIASAGSTDWTEAASAVTTEDSHFVSLDIPTTPKELFVNMFLRVNNAENSLGSGIADGRIEFNQSGIMSNNIYAGKLFQCHASSAWSTFLHIMLVDGIPYLYGRCAGGLITETRGQKFDTVNKIIISTIKSDYLIKSGAIIRIYTR